ncbi:MAG: MFS transporter [Paracoccaceae bacterium]
MVAGVRSTVLGAVSPRFFYGWLMLGVATLGMFASGPGQSHTFSVFVGPIAEELTVSPAAVGSAYALATLVAAFALPFLGRLVDRHGPRWAAVRVSLLFGLACIAFGGAPNLILLGIGFAALRFLGQGSLMLISANLTSQWFDRKRGTAMSIVALGFALSMAVHPPLGQLLIESFGWRAAWVGLGLLTWAILLPPYLMLVIDRPEDAGLRPDGAVAPPLKEGETETPAEIKGLTLSEATRTAAFYLVFFGLFSISMLVTVLHFYQVTIFAENGFAARTASLAFTVSAVTMAVTMPLVGRLLDRIATRFVVAMALVTMAGALLLATVIGTLPGLIVYALVFGLTNAFSITLFGYLWPRFFGRKHVGSIQGTGQTGLVIGASLGPPLVGFAAEFAGGFDMPLRWAALFPLALAVLVGLFLKTPAALGPDAGRD